MTARKTSISPDFPFRNTIRYFDSDQMLEESKSLSKRKLQVEHSGGRESKVQRKQTQKRNKLQTSYQTNTSPLLFFVLFVSFLLKYARTSEGSAPASRAGALANRVRSARFALAKRARSARAVFILWWVAYFAGSAIQTGWHTIEHVCARAPVSYCVGLGGSQVDTVFNLLKEKFAGFRGSLHRRTPDHAKPRRSVRRTSLAS